MLYNKEVVGLGTHDPLVKTMPKQLTLYVWDRNPKTSLVLVIMDYATRRPEVFPIRSTESSVIAQHLAQMLVGLQYQIKYSRIVGRISEFHRQWSEVDHHCSLPYSN